MRKIARTLAHEDEMLERVSSKEERVGRGGQVVTRDQHTEPMNGNSMQRLGEATVPHHQTSGGAAIAPKRSWELLPPAAPRMNQPKTMLLGLGGTP